jgi:cytochrome c oxidase cbb3-type subunit 2
MTKGTHKPKETAPVKAALLVGCTFFYFLIFAQFGFLHRLTEIDPEKKFLEITMLTMGLGGVLGTIRAARRFNLKTAKAWLVSSFITCGVAASLSGLMTIPSAILLIALIVGLSLGILTVSIVSILRSLIPSGQIGIWTSLGVGSAYFFANIPPIFRFSTSDHCIASALACIGGALLAMTLPAGSQSPSQETPSSTPIVLFRSGGAWITVTLFFLLIWLDSAAFYTIQETETLKASSWGETFQLWSNAIIHLVFALLSGWLLDRGRLFSLLITSLLFLVSGIWFLQSGSSIPSWLAVSLYVAGVSLYSAGLVSYGALSPEKKTLWTIPARAGMVFAIGGWIGSGMGIGMAKDLHRVPISFILFALICSGLAIIVYRVLLKQNDSKPA